MAKSALQRKREQVERDRQAMSRLPDSSYPFLTRPFYDWLRDNDDNDWHIFVTQILAAGLEAPEFVDDRGPSSLDGVYEGGLSGTEDNPYAGYERSIGRAESIADLLVSSAYNLALVIRAYKLEQINERITEIETADLSDPESRKAALSDIVKLEKIREQLQKKTRHEMPTYKVKGI